MRKKNIVIILLSVFVLVLGGFLYKTVDYIKNNNNNSTNNMKEIVLKSLKERRSIRSYKSMQISDEDLNAVLEAGEYAPSGMNKQSALMVVVQDPAKIREMAKINASFMENNNGDADFKDPFYGAPTVVIVFADSTIRTYVNDGSLVMGNLLNAAHAVGLGSCWINRARETFQSEQGKAMMKEWGISDKYVGIGNCILGYPEGDHPKAAPRKSDYIIRVK